MSRYLTLEGKRLEMAGLTNSIYEEHLETELLPWLGKLNTMDGVCTLQSCGGHRYSDTKNNAGDTYVSHGHLWLWLSEEMSSAFYTKAFELAESELIEGVSIMFQRYGQEVVNISFKGRERGKMRESLDLIVRFFEGLCEIA